MLDAHPAPVVVWLNEFFGDVRNDGKDFTESGLYAKHRDRVTGIVRFEKRNPDTFGRDLVEMASRKLTFNEALDSADFGVMPRQRLKTVKMALYAQLDQVGL